MRNRALRRRPCDETESDDRVVFPHSVGVRDALVSSQLSAGHRAADLPPRDFELVNLTSRLRIGRSRAD
jgi:hypothetical protein